MGIGAGILIAAVGAVLRFAVTAEVDGVDLQTVGSILLVAGIAIALIALIVTAMRRPGPADQRVVYENYDDTTGARV
jgi:hypothetical protein